MQTYQSTDHYLKALPEGKPFLASTLHHLTSSSNARQILHRLTKAGTVQRIARGVFIKIPQSSKSMSSPALLDILTARLPNETLTMQGAEAASYLSLSTQVPMQIIFYTNGNTRTLNVGNQTVYLKHVSPKRLIGVGTMTGIVISALYYIGKENFNLNIIRKIATQLSKNEFQAVLESMPHMPAWMADGFHRYKKLH